MSEKTRMDGAILPYPKTGYNAIIRGEIGSLPNRRFSLPAFSLLHNEQTLTRCLNMDEVKDFHPLVAQWLQTNGYDYKHEYSLPDFGRIDFYATHPEHGTLLLECKCNVSAPKLITQIVTYGVQIPNAKLAVAVPMVVTRKNLLALAKKYDVQVIEIDTSSVVRQPKKKTVKPKRKTYTRNSYRKPFSKRLIRRRSVSFIRSDSDLKTERSKRSSYVLNERLDSMDRVLTKYLKFGRWRAMGNTLKELGYLRFDNDE